MPLHKRSLTPLVQVLLSCTVLYYVRCNLISQYFADVKLADLKRAEVKLADIKLADYCHTRLEGTLQKIPQTSSFELLTGGGGLAPSPRPPIGQPMYRNKTIEKL